MSFIQRKSYDVPTAGKIPAVLADFQERGERQTAFGIREEVRLVYFTDQLDSKKRPIQVMQSLTRSLDERSNLFAVISGVLGGNVPDDGIDPETLVGRQVTLEIEIVSGKRGPYAKVLNVAPGADGQNVAVPATFKRTKRS
ncbi:MAG: hypothetical protein WB952_08085 [Terriglobales bacterium]